MSETANKRHVHFAQYITFASPHSEAVSEAVSDSDSHENSEVATYVDSNSTEPATA